MDVVTGRKNDSEINERACRIGKSVGTFPCGKFFIVTIPRVHWIMMAESVRARWRGSTGIGSPGIPAVVMNCLTIGRISKKQSGCPDQHQQPPSYKTSVFLINRGSHRQAGTFRFLAKQNVPGLSWRKIKASPMTLTPQTVAIPLNAIHNCAEKEKAGIVGRKGSDYLFKWRNYKPK